MKTKWSIKVKPCGPNVFKTEFTIDNQTFEIARIKRELGCESVVQARARAVWFMKMFEVALGKVGLEATRKSAFTRSGTA